MYTFVCARVNGYGTYGILLHHLQSFRSTGNALAHARRMYDFEIPSAKYCTDKAALLEYLGEKVPSLLVVRVCMHVCVGGGVGASLVTRTRQAQCARPASFHPR
jgi:tRNA A37 threonylcarbamoyltransferase TsaD